ncbi:protein of unknown function [Candidatus Nitrosacidococcus tergens]|uniref:Uncharacterized protein n=1 Tax=Candidatus Nitrosacidococcus tergens TaxID=553981 RepID=A0A7G1Q725_9GAMM|nr:protein of unknown function [Candidatus Nitrosacidococcus tergens]
MGNSGFAVIQDISEMICDTKD